MDTKQFSGYVFGTGSFIPIFYSLFLLSLVLVQGSVYWLILIKRLSVPEYGVNTVGKLFRAFKTVDIVLLCLGIPLIVICHNSVVGTVVSMALLLFALVEWINYFMLRLSYGYNPAVIIRLIKNGKLKKSKIADEIKSSVKQ
jgi:hypothetical protein